MSKFILGDDVEREALEWGELGWLSTPSATGAKELTVIDVTLHSGHGHDFHKHPNQEELIFVREGQIEQWLEQDSHVLGPGDSVYIDADTVHASFNTGGAAALLTVVLGPCVGDGGYELVDVAAEAPWDTLRSG